MPNNEAYIQLTILNGSHVLALFPLWLLFLTRTETTNLNNLVFCRGCRGVLESMAREVRGSNPALGRNLSWKNLSNLFYVTFTYVTRKSKDRSNRQPIINNCNNFKPSGWVIYIARHQGEEKKDASETLPTLSLKNDVGLATQAT